MQIICHQVYCWLVWIQHLGKLVKPDSLDKIVLLDEKML